MKFTAISILLLLIASCGGRVSRPVSVETDLDARLSCAHINGEYFSNKERIVDIENEASFQSQQNVGRVLTGQILFLDGNDEEAEEIEALQARNIKLQEISGNNNCNPLVSF